MSVNPETQHHDVDEVAALLATPLDDVATAARGKPFDAVVVGTGPTGVAAARTLAWAHLRVALLERGPLRLLTHASSSELRWAGTAVRDLQDRLTYRASAADGTEFGSLVACVGGRGVFWNGASPRYLPTDFAAWPIEPTDLSEEYAWAEADLFVSKTWGTTRLARWMRTQLRSKGIRGEPEPFAVDHRRSTNGWLSGTIGNPVSSLLRSGLVGRPRDTAQLVLSTGAFLRRIDLATQRTNGPLGVIVRDMNNGADHIIETRSVVLACGGFESVRVAISSGVGDRSGLLGRELSDHWFARGYFPVSPATYDATAPEAGAVLVRPRAERPFQIELHAPGRRFFLGRGIDWEPTSDEQYSVMIRAFAPTCSPTQSSLEVLGDETPGAFAVDLPETDADRNLTAQMVGGIDQARLALDAATSPIDVYPLGSSYHEAGGLAMARDPRTGVTDPFGRCWANPRIVVVDASSWPRIGCANPHLTLVAMARRQAAQLARDLTADTDTA